MDKEEIRKSGIWLDVLSFTVFLTLAYFLKWQSHDLLWSLWVGSLVIGYFTILSSIGADFFLNSKGGHAGSGSGGLQGALFSLIFFTIHFGMFHFAHSVFLREHFPLAEGLNDPSLEAFPQIIPPLLQSYGVFLIPALITQRHTFLEMWKDTRYASDAEASQSSDKKRLNPMLKPYKSVMIMHILIFVIATLHHYEVGNFYVYALVYTVYFFPWRIVKKAESVNLSETGIKAL